MDFGNGLISVVLTTGELGLAIESGVRREFFTEERDQMIWDFLVTHFRKYGVARSHPMVGPTGNIGVEEDTETSFWFMGRKFEVADQPGQYSVPCQEDLDRLYKYIRAARRQAADPCRHPGASGTRSWLFVDILMTGMVARPDANGPREKSGQSLPL